MAINIPGVDFSAAGHIKPDYGKWLLHGAPGSGKTTLASTIASMGKTLYIDFVGERGTRSFAGASYEGNIDIARPTSVKNLEALYNELANGGHGYQAVVIDSLTAMQRITMRYLQGYSESSSKEIDPDKDKTSFRTWGQSLSIMTDLAVYWFDLANGQRANPMHVVMTAQTKVLDDETTETRIRMPDIQRGAQSIVCGSADYIAYCEVEPNPEAYTDDDPPSRHVVRFGSHPDYRTKARIPVDLRGSIPPILGRKGQSPDLSTMTKLLRIGTV